MDQPQHEWPARAQEFIERPASACPLEGLKFRVSLVAGATGPEVLRFAGKHGSDLIVVSWHGEWEGAHAKTLKTLLAQATCPVMVV